MKTYKLIIPDTSDIEIGDEIEINGIKHKLIEGSANTSNCGRCTINYHCRKAATVNLCGSTHGKFILK